RWQHADRLAEQAGWQKLHIPAGSFVLTAYAPLHAAPVDALTVYIEGDGLAWLTRSQPSNDPTPRNPVGLQLALRHPHGLAVYLARPCQYVAPQDAQNCRQAYWTDGRFAPEVIDASDLAISELMRRFGAERLELVGYSGGGAVAALVAARRKDVLRLVTVAGNLDHRAWTEIHRVPALAGSLNAADAWRALDGIPQRHFVGGSDQIVSRVVANSYAAHFPPGRKPEIVVVPGFDHACCWVDAWPELVSDSYLTNAGARR
ncbi:MAG: alpha/beta hydrolase, partial [Actinomycetota bacterium]|nr:alpha/beta hydrolase [Actinomycetota bacterium]